MDNRANNFKINMFEKMEHIIKLAIGTGYVTVTEVNLKIYVCKADRNFLTNCSYCDIIDNPKRCVKLHRKHCT